MRKLLVTFLSFCLMAGLLAATSLPAAAMASPGHKMDQAMASAPVDCPQHGANQKAPAGTPHKQGNLSCCITGQCPMLGQGLLPAIMLVADLPQRPKLLPAAEQDIGGIDSGPGFRPPRIHL